MKKKGPNKKLLIFLGLAVVIAIVAAVVLGGGGSSTPQTGLVTSSPTGQVVTPGTIANDPQSQANQRSQELVVLLRSVSSLSLDDAVFLNPVYGILEDISSQLPPDRNPGRRNPFLPIGEEPGPADLGFTFDATTDFGASDTVTTTTGGVNTSNGDALVGDDALDAFLSGGESDTPDQGIINGGGSAGPDA